MGTWGPGAFDNDDAADWALTLSDSGDDALLRSAFGQIDKAHPEELPSEVAVAAAAVVAAGRSGTSQDLPDAVAAWLEAHPDLPWNELAQDASVALSKIATDSELRDLWEESEAADAYKAELEELQRRLG